MIDLIIDNPLVVLIIICVFIWALRPLFNKPKLLSLKMIDRKGIIVRVETTAWTKDVMCKDLGDDVYLKTFMEGGSIPYDVGVAITTFIKSGRDSYAVNIDR